MANCVSSDLQESSGFCWENSDDATVLKVDMPFLAPAPPQVVNSDEATSFHFNGYPFSFRPPPRSSSLPYEGRASASASRSHSEAEKRRRDRINAQLATLRRLIPKSEKMDKAALLGRAVENLKDMKGKAMEIGKVVMIPTDIDEVTVDEYPCGGGGYIGGRLLKASISCDDRTELFSEVNRALKSLRLTIVHAEMISLGGRIKSIFILCGGGGGGGGEGGGVVCMDTLKQSLSRIVTSCSNTGPNYRIKSRRQRIFLSSDH